MRIVSADLSYVCHSALGEAIRDADAPYSVIPRLSELITELSGKLGEDFYEKSPGVFIARDAKIAESAVILAPTVIGHKSELRTGAYIRGGTLIGDGCVIGNSTEIKNSVIFDGAQLPHYNYVGDSIIGYRAHLGAGAIISNLRLDKANVKIRFGRERCDTGIRKLGALIGDFAEIGCGAVISPGVIIGRRALVYPLSSVTKCVPSGAKFIGQAVCEPHQESEV